MNVTYPVVDDEILEFCAGKRAVLLVEEGQPDYIEQNLNTILRRNGVDTALHGKDMLPVAGEYTSAAVTKGIAEFLRAVLPDADRARTGAAARPRRPGRARSRRAVAAEVVQPRAPGLCTGCPERPIFTGLKLAERETGEHHVSADIGCHLFAINAPFELGATTMGYGLGSAGAAALERPRRRPAHGRRHGRRRLLAQRIDQRRRQRCLQQVRPAAGRRRQRLRGGDRRPGPALLQGREPRRDRPSIRSRRRRAASGSSGRRTIDDTYDVGSRARHLHGGAYHRGERPEGRRDAERVPAQPPATGQDRRRARR